MNSDDWANFMQDTISQLLAAMIEMAAKINELNARVVALEAATDAAPQEETTT